MRYVYFTVIFLFAFTGPSIGQSTSEDDFYEMSLEDLVNFDISVASKQEEKIMDAPGSITAYSNQDMQNLGYYTLRDLADITSGYSSFRGIGEITFETRGQYAGGGFDNNKHLVLIDGIPFSHTRANRANAEEDLPLFFAKRVEFLKGPGSALYGISAFYGVMNIVSKDVSEQNTLVESKFSLGNYDFKKRLMTNIVHRSETGLSKIAIGLFSKDATREPLGNGISQPYDLNSLNYDDQTSTFLNVSHEITSGFLSGFSIGTIYSKKTGGLGDFWMGDQNQTYEVNEITWEQIVPYMKYQRSLDEKLTINGYLKGNISNESAYIGGAQSTFSNGTDPQFAHYNKRIYDYEGLSEITYDYSEETKIIGGINLVSRYDPGAPNSYSYSFQNDPGISFLPDTSLFGKSSRYNTYSIFTQLQQQIVFLKGLTLTAGARMDIGHVLDANTHKEINKYDQISPRIALVQKVTDAFNIKIMYGSALRAPLIKEVGINEEFKNENPDEADNVADVIAETIKTYELSATFCKEKYNIVANFFLNQTTNPINKIPSGIEDKNINGNTSGHINTNGFEFDITLLPSKNFRIGSNFSYAHAIQYDENDISLGDVYNVPVSKLNSYFTFKHHIPFNYSLTLINHLITDYRAGGITPWGNYENELMDGYHVTDLNVIGQISKNLNLELQVRNIFNTEIKTPTFYAANNLSIPFAGRSFLGTVSVKF